MVVILIYQRSTALRDLLKCPHKPELSKLGVHLTTQARGADVMLGLHKNTIWQFLISFINHLIKHIANYYKLHSL